MIETTEVYIGNGKTIYPEIQAKTKIVDIDKLRKLFTENQGKEIYAGMSTDWFFTATPLKSEADIDNLSLRASCWDTPVVMIDDVKTDWYIEVDKKIYGMILEMGYKRGIYRFEFWLNDFYNRFNKLEYGKLKAFWAEVETILSKAERA